MKTPKTKTMQIEIMGDKAQEILDSMPPRILVRFPERTARGMSAWFTYGTAKGANRDDIMKVLRGIEHNVIVDLAPI